MNTRAARAPQRCARHFLAFLFLGLLCPAAAFADLRVTATLEPQEITLGEAAQLTVSVEGSATASAPGLTSVDGLEFAHAGQSTNIQFINGAMSGGVTHIYQVVARREGVFRIPEITVNVGGTVLKTIPLTLKVGRPSASLSIPPSSSPATPSSTAPDTPPAEAAMIQFLLPKRDLFVGEMAPADLKVYLRQGLQVSNISIPQIAGNAFSVGRLGNKPEQATETLNGVPYTVVTWRTALSAVKAGEHPLSAQMQCTLLVRDSSRRRRFGDNFFDDPFFDNFFGGGVQQKQVTLQTRETLVRVLPLPAEGRPADYAGAIGRFNFSTEASPREVTAGDPVTLRMKVIGVGNFDRIQAPEVAGGPIFKTYPPAAKFEPTTESGEAGQKIFEQVLIPQNTEAHQIPEVRFSYFDSEAKKYVTLSSAPIPLKISAGTAIPAPAVSSTIVQSPPPNPTAGASSASDLLPNKLETGRMRADLRPLPAHPGFWIMPCATALAWVALFGVVRRRERLARDPRRAAAIFSQRTVRAQVEAMDAAIRRGEAPAFFEAARRAIQERLGLRWSARAETITLSEINERSSHDPLPVEGARRIFEAADAVTYSGQNFSGEQLHEWKRLVLETLRQLEEKR